MQRLYQLKHILSPVFRASFVVHVDLLETWRFHRVFLHFHHADHPLFGPWVKSDSLLRGGVPLGENDDKETLSMSCMCKKTTTLKCVETGFNAHLMYCAGACLSAARTGMAAAIFWDTNLSRASRVFSVSYRGKRIQYNSDWPQNIQKTKINPIFEIQGSG